jgi:hemin uptake protein HemP
MSNARYGLRVRNGLVQGITQGLAVEPPLLDTYPNAAAAYSLRKLRSAYTGNAIRVRRSNDNSEQDIGFVFFGQLDTVALLSFVGANNGFVVTWYDQSGNNRNATQTTQANQPQIVSSGSLITENGKVAIRTMGNEYLTVPSSQATFNFLHNGTNSSVFSVNKFGTSSNPNAVYGLFGNSASTSANIGVSFLYDDRTSVPRNNALYQDIGRGALGAQSALQVVDNTITPNQQNIISQFFDADNATAANRLVAYVNAGGAINANTLTNAPTLSNATFDFQIMATGNNTVPMDGTCQEIIIYPTQTSQTGLRDNLNSFYNAY